MILPEDRLKFSGVKRKNNKPFIIIALILILAVVTVIFIFSVNRNLDEVNIIQNDDSVQSIESLWENQHYETINIRCEDVLKEDPMDMKALVYNGFSYFYRGTSQYSLEEKIPLFDSALVNLRRALLVCNDDIIGKIKYIIDKSYFHKGKYFSDLTIK